MENIHSDVRDCKGLTLIAYPNATAEANDSPKAADFPRPRAAVSVTVLLKVFSDIASMNLRTAFALERNQKYSQWNVYLLFSFFWEKYINCKFL